MCDRNYTTGGTPLASNLLLPKQVSAELRAHPQLRSIGSIRGHVEGQHVASFLPSGGPAYSDYHATVRSVRYMDSEILHLRVLSSYAPIADIAWTPEDPQAPERCSHRMIYTAPDGTTRATIFARQKSSSYYHYTDLNGEAVPLEVMEQMRMVEGRKDSYWQGRQIPVGARAWGVIEDWKRRTLAEKGDLAARMARTSM